MARKAPDDPDQEAALFEAMAHPFRVAIRNELRKESPLTILELRKRVSESYEEVDTRNLQFHLMRMQTVARVVEVYREGGRDSVRLLRDLSVNEKAP